MNSTRFLSNIEKNTTFLFQMFTKYITGGGIWGVGFKVPPSRIETSHGECFAVLPSRFIQSCMHSNFNLGCTSSCEKMYFSYAVGLY